MSDLISKKAIMSHIETQYQQWGEDYDTEQILGDIEDFPTYNMVKVIEQLEEKILNTSDSQFGIATRMAFEKAIEIIKSGGAADE